VYELVPAAAEPVGPEAPISGRRRALRIRVGVLLVVLSWVPFAQLAVWLTSASGSQADRLRAVIWGVQIVIGMIGVVLAGRETVRIAKSVGWRKSPAVVWKLLRSPDTQAAT
jgi:hypothetical protein